jgi:hypothetical protein
VQCEREPIGRQVACSKFTFQNAPRMNGYHFLITPCDN